MCEVEGCFVCCCWLQIIIPFSLQLVGQRKTSIKSSETNYIAGFTILVFGKKNLIKTRIKKGAHNALIYTCWGCEYNKSLLKFTQTTTSCWFPLLWRYSCFLRYLWSPGSSPRCRRLHRPGLWSSERLWRSSACKTQTARFVLLRYFFYVFHNCIWKRVWKASFFCGSRHWKKKN